MDTILYPSPSLSKHDVYKTAVNLIRVNDFFIKLLSYPLTLVLLDFKQAMLDRYEFFLLHFKGVLDRLLSDYWYGFYKRYSFQRLKLCSNLLTKYTILHQFYLGKHYLIPSQFYQLKSFRSSSIDTELLEYDEIVMLTISVLLLNIIHHSSISV